MLKPKVAFLPFWLACSQGQAAQEDELRND